MGVFDKLKELAGDNTELKAEIEAVSGEYSKLYSSNEDLTGQLQKALGDRDEHDKRRQNAMKQIEELTGKIESMPKGNEDHLKQMEQLKTEYESKLGEYEDKVKDYENKYVDSLRKSSFAELNLAAKLPKGMNDEAVKAAINFMQFDLSSQGLDYDGENGSFVFKKDGVVAVNPATAKPYTLGEMAEQRISSGAWDNFVNTTPNPSGANRGTTESGGKTLKSINRAGFDAMSPGERHNFIVNEGGKVTQD